QVDVVVESAAAADEAAVLESLDRLPNAEGSHHALPARETRPGYAATGAFKEAARSVRPLLARLQRGDRAPRGPGRHRLIGEQRPPGLARRGCDGDPRADLVAARPRLRL